MRRLGVICAMTMTLLAAATAPLWVSEAAAQPAKQLFGAQQAASEHAPQVYGGYAKGCLAGALRLLETGPGLRWQAMRLSRNRNWGHPDLLAYVERLSAKAQSIGWPSLLVGDMAQPRGGPMLTGHRSHQSGIDVDIWMRPGPATELSRAERERLSSVSVLADDKRTLNANWTPRHLVLLFEAARDPAVARIFVNPAIKKRICADLRAASAPTDWLRKIRPWYGHHYHFHVRLHCPAGSPQCRPQDPPPLGDGCGAELDWWLSDEVLFPKPDPNAPPPKRRREITLDDLPEACRVLVSR